MTKASFFSTLRDFLAVSVFGPPPARADDDPGEAWRRYLSDAEQNTLARLAAGARLLTATKFPVKDQTLLSAAREGFSRLAAFFMPPPDDVVLEPFSGSGVRGLWFRPPGADKDKVILYLHGGAYVMGSPMTAAAISGFLAKEAGLTCFSLDYPLAPEFPFPAAPDNALAAYRLLLDRGYKPEDIVLAGDSAGGGLALALLLDIRERSLPRPAGAYLLSPWTDLGHSFSSHELKNMADPLVTRHYVEWMAGLYAGDNDRRTPRLSPAFADLTGLPPLLIHVGSHEALLDDSLTVLRNAALADVPAAFMSWPGYGHVFQMLHGQLEGGRKALQDGAAFFGEALGRTLLLPKA